MRRLLGLLLAAFLLVPGSAGAIVDNGGGGGRDVKILGGAVAAPGQFPWMAALMDSSADRAIDGVFCGGTVIAPQVVLTAHHCIDGTKASEVNVIVGRTRLSQDGDGQRIAVTQIDAYPGYNSKSVVGDVALLKLATPTTVQPMPIAHPADSALATPGTDVVTIGWGATQEGGNISDELRFVRLTVRSHNKCDAIYGPIPDASQLCIGSDRAGEDSCQGDSGGPVISGPGAAARLIGTVSYGQGCGHKGVPGVYTRISRYASWIDQHAAALNGSAPTPVPAVDAPVVKIGKISCAAIYCDVFLRTSGRAPAGGIVLNVVRKKSKGHKAVDAVVFAKQLSPSKWRAHVNLPYGNLTLYAIPLTSSQDDLDGDGDVERIQVSSG
ncbi:MAG: putative trypsin-like protease [Solirubrobacteraceae bacterium]|nr:putative trypsin-like protease [Solirubrobacteraceae bacterium]